MYLKVDSKCFFFPFMNSIFREQSVFSRQLLEIFQKKKYIFPIFLAFSFILPIKNKKQISIHLLVNFVSLKIRPGLAKERRCNKMIKRQDGN